MESVRLTHQSTSLANTFVPNPYDPLDIQDSSKSLSTHSQLFPDHEKAPSIAPFQISNKDQIDPEELQSLLNAIKGLNAKPKSAFSSLAQWAGPILTLLSCAAAAYAYIEYTTLSNQNSKCHSDLMNATQNADLIPLTFQALFPNANDFASTAANTIFENLSKSFNGNSGLVEGPEHCTYGKKGYIDPVTGAVTHRIIHCSLDTTKLTENTSNEPQINLSSTNKPTANFTCIEHVSFDQYHYNMNIIANCSGEYLTADSKAGKYTSHEKLVLASQARGPNSVLHVEQTLCETDEVNGNRDSSCNTLNTDTTIEEFIKTSAQSDMVNRILSGLKV